MSLVQKFVEQRRAFEAAYDGGDWGPLAAYFHDAITYEVMNMPFHCVVTGRDAVVAGMQKSIERFDKLCVRTVGLDRKVVEEGDNVLVHSGLRFERAGAPPFESRLWEIATYRDGLMVRLLDIYDPGDGERFAHWMTKWGTGLDPRYV